MYDIVSVFVFRMHRQPSSTLFPYTTLFRSDVVSAHDLANLAKMRVKKALAMMRQAPFSHNRAAARDDAGHPLCRQGDEDRKSTRLNSSHANTSYAVFCLKKKRYLPPQPGRA